MRYVSMSTDGWRGARLELPSWRSTTVRTGQQVVDAPIFYSHGITVVLLTWRS